MFRNVRVRMWAGAALGLALMTGLASLAQADTIAEWNFGSTGGDLYTDASGHGHALSQWGGTASQSTVTPSGSGYSAYLSSGSGGLYTTNNLDLSSYRHISISWSQMCQTASEALVFEYSADTNANVGGFYFDVNTGTSAPGAVSLKDDSPGFFNGVGVTSLDTGSSNTTWDNMRLDINLDATSNTEVLHVYHDNTLVSSYTNWFGGSGAQHAAPSTFGSYRFYIGTRDSEAGHYTGYIADLKISSVVVPEPSTIALVGMGLVSLLAYAWRKRK